MGMSRKNRILVRVQIIARKIQELESKVFDIDDDAVTEEGGRLALDKALALTQALEKVLNGEGRSEP